MELKTVAVTYGRKQNLGDYSSANIEIKLWADLDDDDDEVKATEALRQMARNHVMAELARLQPALKAKVQDVFMGLPADVQKAVDADGIEYEPGKGPNGLDTYRGDAAKKRLDKDLDAILDKHMEGGM